MPANGGLAPGGATALSGDTGEATLLVHGMTCQSCVRRVRAALKAVPGVETVSVELASGRAVIRFDSPKATLEDLRTSVEGAGYSVGKVPDPAISSGIGGESSPPPERERTGLGMFLLPTLLGLAGSIGLLGLYLGLVTLAQGFEHAVDLLLEDRYLVTPIILGFGTQVGLFAHLRRTLRARTSRSANALAGAGTGTSGVAMVACCAHHLADVLPFVGLSGAALFLAEYRQPLMIMGIATNLVGIGVMVRAVRSASRCHS